MRVCFLADASHPNTLNWITYFADVLGHEVHVISFNSDPSETTNYVLHFLDYGSTNLKNMWDYNVKNYLKYTFLKSKLKFFLAVPRVKNILKQIQPDLLIGYRLISYGLTAALSRFHPLVVVTQSQQIVHPPHSKVLRYLAKYVIREADMLQAWANHSQNRLIELGAKRNKIICFPKGVDTSLYNLKPCSNPNVSTMISTRSLRPEYGTAYIIKAVEYVVREISNFRYMILGDGNEREILEKKTKQLQLTNNIEFLGRRPINEIPSFLQQSDIYISASPFDSVSASLLEAMACGVFPIVSDNEANKFWIKNGVNGFLVAHNDPQSIADRIVEACRNIELRERARKINIEIITKSASMEKNMRKMEKIYLRLIN